MSSSRFHVDVFPADRADLPELLTLTTHRRVEGPQTISSLSSALSEVSKRMRIKLTRKGNSIGNLNLLSANKSTNSSEVNYKYL
jgi:hypothetical protein